MMPWEKREDPPKAEKLIFSDDPNALLPPTQAAKYLSITSGYLKVLRYSGNGPDFIRISERNIRYRKADLDKWIESRRFSSTSGVSASRL
jgi:predicted DNA-binding transcriptional regulator AlpA